MTVKSLDLPVEQSIWRMPARPADHRVTLHQIGPMVLASCGARDYIRDDEAGLIKFKIGNGRRWCTVKLLADDTYGVEIGRMRKLDYLVVDQQLGIHAEDLPRVVREMADREF